MDAKAKERGRRYVCTLDECGRKIEDVEETVGSMLIDLDYQMERKQRLEEENVRLRQWLSFWLAGAPTCSHCKAEAVKILSERPTSGWLIEGRGEGGQPQWLGMHIPTKTTFWVTDSLQALRFARREDAKTAMEYWGAGDCVTEHTWG